MVWNVFATAVLQTLAWVEMHLNRNKIYDDQNLDGVFFADMEAKCWCLLKQYQSSKNSLDLSWKFERASSKGICEIKIVIGAWTPILPESWFSAKSP